MRRWGGGAGGAARGGEGYSKHPPTDGALIINRFSQSLLFGEALRKLLVSTSIDFSLLNVECGTFRGPQGESIVLLSGGARNVFLFWESQGEIMTHGGVEILKMTVFIVLVSAGVLCFG